MADLNPGTIMAWWRDQYAPLVAKARTGGPTALHITLIWATAEVEYALAHNAQPEVGVPSHF